MRMLFGVLGSVIALAAVIWGFSIWQFTSRAEIARGTVTKLNSGESHPQIEFKTKDGRTIEYPQGGLIFGYRTGDEVDVYYDPKDPQNCAMKSVGALWGFPLIVFVLGASLAAAGIFLRR